MAASPDVQNISLESDQVAEAAFHAKARRELGDVDPTTTFVSSVGQLQKEHPKLYRNILESLARDMCRELQKHAKRMKNILRNNQHS